MSNWEGYRDRKQNQQNYSVPLAAWRTGDFSSYSGPLYDPATCTVASASGVRTCATFPGNRIPANRIHPTSQKLLEFYPEPNATGTDATGTVNNYTGIQNRVIDKDQFTQRFDFVQSSASTWMGRYSHSRDDEINPALKLNGTKLINRIHQAMVGNTRTLSPTVVNEFRFGYNSFYNTFGRELAFVRDVTGELGIPGMSPLPEAAWGIPNIGLTGLSGFGDSTEGPYTNENKVFEIIDNVSWIKGRHSFKVGAHFRIDHYDQVGNQFPRGGFQFDGRATGSLNGTAATAATVATSFADFLLGYQRLSELSVQLAVTEFRAISQSYYFTDTWRMRDNMTLDLGLRYEYVPPFEDKAGTLINASMPFFDQGLPVADKSRHPTLTRIGEGEFYEDFNIRYNPAIQTARDGRLGNRLVDDDKLNLAPRAGWAWTPTPGTSIRAGVGMFFMQDTGNPRFDMARNAAGRRQDTSNQFFDQNWNAPFVGSGTNACGVQPPIVCIRPPLCSGQRLRPNHSPDDAVPLQRAARDRRQLGDRDRLPRLAQLPPRAHVRSQRRVARTGRRAGQTAVPGVHPCSDDRQRRRSEVQLAERQADAAYEQRVRGADRLHALEIRGQRQRHPHAQWRSAVPAEQQLRGG